MPHHLAGGGLDGSYPAQRLAKEASLPNLWGLSPATINSVAALSVPMPLPKKPTPGRPAPPAGRGAPLAQKRSPRRGPRSGGPPNAARTTWLPWSRHEGHLRGESARSPRRAPSSRARANGCAVARVPSHAQGLQLALAACVLALIAERRTERRALIISTCPSPLLGTPEASPASTARAAASASEGSDFSALRRELRRRCFGCSTSSTSIRLALR
jgi:hypothetical protein